MASATSERTHELPVENPATGERIALVPCLDAAGVAELAERARAAQAPWAQIDPEGRAAILAGLCGWLRTHADELIALVSAEGGKTTDDAALEVAGLVDTISWWCRRGPAWLADATMRSFEPTCFGAHVVVRHVPRGVVGVIAPWNYPLVLGVGDAIPALLAGNAVLLKPSELTPLATRRIVEEGMVASGFPRDLCCVATGDGSTGESVVDHVDMVLFTGSTATGRSVGERAARRLIPAGLELGGKDAMVVLDDADLERAAERAVYWGLCNAGQTCMSVERVYVQAGAYDTFVALVVERVRALRQGPLGPPGSVDIGAMASAAQLEIVERHVADAVAKGAGVLCGGRRLPGPGWFFAPTVLVDVDASMDCLRDETFGPTLPIVRFTDVQAAVAAVNDCDYGLTASVYSRDIARAQAIARQLEVGNCNINDTVVSFVERRAPYGGWKDSGLGVRHSAEGLLRTCRPQTILTAAAGPRRAPYMFPMHRHVRRLIGVWMWIQATRASRPWRRLGRGPAPSRPTPRIPDVKEL